MYVWFCGPLGQTADSGCGHVYEAIQESTLEVERSVFARRPFMACKASLRSSLSDTLPLFQDSCWALHAAGLHDFLGCWLVEPKPTGRCSAVQNEWCFWLAIVFLACKLGRKMLPLTRSSCHQYVYIYI